MPSSATSSTAGSLLSKRTRPAEPLLSVHLNTPLSPTARSPLVGEILTELGARLTVTAHTALTPSALVTVMAAEPARFAVTTPSALTVTYLLLLLLQLNGAL